MLTQTYQDMYAWVHSPWYSCQEGKCVEFPSLPLEASLKYVSDNQQHVVVEKKGKEINFFRRKADCLRICSPKSKQYIFDIDVVRNTLKSLLGRESFSALPLYKNLATWLEKHKTCEDVTNHYQMCPWLGNSPSEVNCYPECRQRCSQWMDEWFTKDLRDLKIVLLHKIFLPVDIYGPKGDRIYDPPIRYKVKNIIDTYAPRESKLVIWTPESPPEALRHLIKNQCNRRFNWLRWTCTAVDPGFPRLGICTALIQIGTRKHRIHVEFKGDNMVFSFHFPILE